MSQTCHIALYCIIRQLLCTSVWYINHVTNFRAEHVVIVRVKGTESRRVRILRSYKIWMRKIRICPATVQWLTLARYTVLTTIWVFFHGATAPSGLGPYYRGFTTKLRHTTLGRTPGLVASPTWQNTTHTRQTSTPQAGFEPTIPAKRTALDRRLRPCGHRDR